MIIKDINEMSLILCYAYIFSINWNELNINLVFSDIKIFNLKINFRINIKRFK